MSAKFVFDLRKSFDIEKKLLLYCGFYPNRGEMNKYLYYLSGFYHLSVSILIQLSMTVLIVLHITNLSTIAEALMFFVTQTAFMWKLANIIIKRELLSKIEEILSNPIFYNLSDGHLELITDYLASTKRFATLYRIICFMVCTTNVILQLVGSKLGHAMLLGWNPWEIDSRIKYYLNCTFQLNAFCVSAYLNSTIDILIAVLITVATAQIEILKSNLSNIQYNTADAKKKFNDNVLLHYEILRFVSAIEDTFSVGILIQIFASVLVICFTGFQMLIVSQESIQFVSLFLYFMCMMAQVAMYCWFGHYLIASSDAINQSVYMSNWYESDISLKRSIIIFMERSKKPIILRAGNMFPLSLVTFTSVIRSSYSYFAVLNRLYDPDIGKL
nr:odorant receptor [Semanotus bifasciatus]